MAEVVMKSGETVEVPDQDVPLFIKNNKDAREIRYHITYPLNILNKILEIPGMLVIERTINSVSEG